MGTNLLPHNEGVTCGDSAQELSSWGTTLSQGWLLKGLGLLGQVVPTCEDAPQPCLQHRGCSPCFL